MIVYISGPMSSDPLSGTRAAIDAGQRVSETGHTPLIPHLSVLWAMIYTNSYSTWIRMDLELLAKCEGLIRLPGESPGSDIEVAEAKKLSIPVYYGVEDFLRSL